MQLDVVFERSTCFWEVCGVTVCLVLADIFFVFCFFEYGRGLLFVFVIVVTEHAV